jgi:hypothetical protein
VFCANLGKSEADALGNDYASLWLRKYEPYKGFWMACSVQGRLKKVRQGKEQSQEHAHYSLSRQGVLFTKDSFWQAKQ